MLTSMTPMQTMHRSLVAPYEAIQKISSQIKTGQSKKDQQLAKAKAWEAEMKRKCKPMKPLTVGCLWSEEALTNLTLAKFSACLLVDSPILVESLTANSQNTEPLAMSSHYNNTGGLYVPDEGTFAITKKHLKTNSLIQS